jgi:hypothetical protein
MESLGLLPQHGKMEWHAPAYQIITVIGSCLALGPHRLFKIRTTQIRSPHCNCASIGCVSPGCLTLEKQSSPVFRPRDPALSTIRIVECHSMSSLCAHPTRVHLCLMSGKSILADKSGLPGDSVVADDSTAVSSRKLVDGSCQPPIPSGEKRIELNDEEIHSSAVRQWSCIPIPSTFSGCS